MVLAEHLDKPQALLFSSESGVLSTQHPYLVVPIPVSCAWLSPYLIAPQTLSLVVVIAWMLPQAPQPLSCPHRAVFWSQIRLMSSHPFSSHPVPHITWDSVCLSPQWALEELPLP